MAGSRHSNGWRRIASETATPRLASELHPHALDVRIVDPDGSGECLGGERGEIVVAGDAVAQGYYGDADASHETFVQLSLDHRPRTYLRTRDLGRIIGASWSSTAGRTTSSRSGA